MDANGSVKIKKSSLKYRICRVIKLSNFVEFSSEIVLQKNDGTTLTIDMLPHDSIGELLKEIEAEFDWSQDRLALNKAKLFYRGSSTFC